MSGYLFKHFIINLQISQVLFVLTKSLFYASIKLVDKVALLRYNKEKIY